MIGLALSFIFLMLNGDDTVTFSKEYRRVRSRLPVIKIPACNAPARGMVFELEGVPDVVLLCIKTAGNAHKWVVIPTGERTQ